ncbi:MAG: oligosaccharide flippase family protein [Bacteroidales bacterium]
MGIIIKQSIKGSIWSYLGVLIGFVTTAYLYTEYLTPEIVGLFGLLIAYSTLFGQISLLGLPGVTSRLFPYFREKASGHNGFLLIGLLFLTVGFSLFLIAYLFFSPQLIENNLEKSKLFADYVFLLLPLTLVAMVFVFLDTYNKVLYNVVFGIFLREFLQRVLILLSVVLYIFNLINLHMLIVAFVLSISIKSIMILIFLIGKGEFKLRINWGFIDKKFRREIFNVALFSSLGGLGSMIVFNIDKIIVNEMLDLSNTGVYTIAFYFGTLVIIPSRPLLKIAGTLIADAWKKNDLQQLKDIYYKSCINQFIIGGFIFLGIWANIDNILIILGEDYQGSKWVIFFIGLGYLFDIMTGANAQFIAFSKHYRVSLYFILLLVAIVIGLLYFLIPLFGITGAAIAVATSLFLNNLMRFLFIYIKFKFQPFNYKFLIIALVYAGTYLLLTFIPQQDLIPDILIRGTIITAFTITAVLTLPVSDEIKDLLSNFLKRR